MFRSLFATGDNTVVTVALVSINRCIIGYLLNLNLVINKAVFLWIVNVLSINQLLGYLYKYKTISIGYITSHLSFISKYKQTSKQQSINGLAITTLKSPLYSVVNNIITNPQYFSVNLQIVLHKCTLTCGLLINSILKIPQNHR